MNDKPYELAFPQHGDERGYLVAIEGGSDVPFEIKRIFYIYGWTKRSCAGVMPIKTANLCLLTLRGAARCECAIRQAKKGYMCLIIQEWGCTFPQRYGRICTIFRMTVFCCAYQAKDTIPTSIYETMTLL